MICGLTDDTVERIRGVLSRHRQVEKAVLYGSRAKGNFRNGSDIDLALMGGNDLDLQVLFRVMDELGDLLLPYQIDSSVFSLIDDADVRTHIEGIGVVLYSRAPEPAEV